MSTATPRTVELGGRWGSETRVWRWPEEAEREWREAWRKEPRTKWSDDGSHARLSGKRFGDRMVMMWGPMASAGAPIMYKRIVKEIRRKRCW